MLSSRKFIVFILLCAITTFALQNPSAISTDFLIWRANVPRILTIFITLIIGIIVGLLIRKKPRSMFK